MKIRWAMGEEADVEKLNADLKGQSGTIELLLLAVEM
jgi:hypothetical protein